MIGNIAIPIITGILGFIAGIIIPFIKWHIEKLKMCRQDKIELIKLLREYITLEDFSEQKFKDTALYSRFREYLPRKLKERIDNKEGIIYIEVSKGGRDGLQNELLDQLCLLEKKWKLI